MAEILILYSTTDGHTRAICQRLERQLQALGNQVIVADVEQSDSFDLQAMDKIVIGASIRYGKHQAAVYRFVEQHQALLDTRPNAFFSVNLVARKAHKRSPQTNPYVRKFLSQISWQPQHVEVFAGRLDYPSYSRLDRMVIRLIMWITSGPTDPNAVIDFTDWDQVTQFGRAVHEL